MSVELTEEELSRRLWYTAQLAAVGKISAGAAHEINQPLNVIRMAAYNIKRSIEKDSFDPASVLEKLQRIDAQVTRAAELVGGMKSFSPTSSGGQTALNPSDSVRIALALLAKRFTAVEAEVEHHPCTATCEAQVEPSSIQALVTNIVDNALEAFALIPAPELDLTKLGQEGVEMPPPRKVTITEKTIGNCFHCIIEDTAGGIPDDVMPHVFEPFFTTAEDGSRAGLGLSNCKQLLDSLGGDIEIENTETGTRVTFTLPVNVTIPAPE